MTQEEKMLWLNNLPPVDPAKRTSNSFKMEHHRDGANDVARIMRWNVEMQDWVEVEWRDLDAK